MTLRNAVTASTAAIAILGWPAASPADAELIAGWDFSQYAISGLNSIDGATFTAVLDANYSDLDPTFNAGAESAAFGTMYVDGSFGSTSVPVESSTAQFFPTASAPGSLSSNLFAPVVNPFDSFTILADEGQPFTQLLAMTVTDVVKVVFEATLESVPSARAAWVLTLAGKTFSGMSPVAVEFSTDGSSYSSIGTVDLDTIDTRFEVPLEDVLAETVFVRLTLDPTSGQPVIDNLAIETPEPGAVLSLMSVLVGLATLRRRAAAAAA